MIKSSAGDEFKAFDGYGPPPERVPLSPPDIPATLKGNGRREILTSKSGFKYPKPSNRNGRRS